MSAKSLRVLVVDDTVIYRKIVSDILGQMPGVEVVGAASNGRTALEKIDLLKPDLLTLDLEMPELDGLGVLRQLQSRRSRIGVIMLSAFTEQGAEATMQALSLGAFDFVPKPATGSAARSEQELRTSLREKIEAFLRTRGLESLLGEGKAPPPPPPPPKAVPTVSLSERMRAVATSRVNRPKVVGIGVSTGGPQALNRVLPSLQSSLNVPILIVQHMPPVFTKSLADDLNKKCPLTVQEAAHDQPIEAGTILIAPGGKHMKIGVTNGEKRIIITDDPPENSCKPAVDYLFRSIANLYGGAALGVILTGMGNDGALGCRLMKRQGATILAQDQATSVVYGMPKAVADDGTADIVVPLETVAESITQIVCGGAVACR